MTKVHKFVHLTDVYRCVLDLRKYELCAAVVWRARPFRNEERVWSNPYTKVVSPALYSAGQSDHSASH